MGCIHSKDKHNIETKTNIIKFYEEDINLIRMELTQLIIAMVEIQQHHYEHPIIIMPSILLGNLLSLTDTLPTPKRLIEVLDNIKSDDNNVFELIKINKMNVRNKIDYLTFKLNNIREFDLEYFDLVNTLYTKLASSYKHKIIRQIVIESLFKILSMIKDNPENIIKYNNESDLDILFAKYYSGITRYNSCYEDHGIEYIHLFLQFITMFNNCEKAKKYIKNWNYEIVTVIGSIGVSIPDLTRIWTEN